MCMQQTANKHTHTQVQGCRRPGKFQPMCLSKPHPLTYPQIVFVTYISRKHGDASFTFRFLIATELTIIILTQTMIFIFWMTSTKDEISRLIRMLWIFRTIVQEKMNSGSHCSVLCSNWTGLDPKYQHWNHWSITIFQLYSSLIHLTLNISYKSLVDHSNFHCLLSLIPIFQSIVEYKHLSRACSCSEYVILYCRCTRPTLMLTYEA